MLLLWLDDPSCDDLLLAGGKAASLSRLGRHHRVPPGFCITTAAYDRAVGDGLPPEALPDWLRGEVASAYARLATIAGIEEPIVAVRSSAVDEDGAAASFAGQHETYLNITGLDAVAYAVARCWASARSERALEYRRRQGLALDAVRLAVLVQQLVPADTAAVAFSANPVTGNRDEVLINASWGLGESIVGGLVTPDTFVVDKRASRITSSAIAEKEVMTIAVDGGTEETEVPRFLRDQPSLDEEQALEIARLATMLEERTGAPVDIECAFHNGELYLLQCRPITTLG
jgi:pyruvate,water dikinase